MKARVTLLVAFLCAWTGAVAARLVHLQLVEGAHYRRQADGQQQGRIVLTSPRGTIFDARGRELAVSLAVESAWVDPSDGALPPAGELVGRLAAILPGLDRNQLLARIGQSDSRFAWVARQLDPPLAERLRRAAIPGVRFRAESRRFYPLRGLAAPVLGIVGRDDRGLAGLEFRFDGVVRGRPIERRVVRDGASRASHVAELVFADAQPGADLELTLDASIQHVAERELASAVERHRAAGGAAIVLDPASGAVLAMASYPGFDPNRFAEFPAERRRNRAVTDTFEPGSTFKAVVAAAALAGNVVDPEDRIDCGLGAVVLDRVRIRDHRPFGWLTFREVIARSSNVGALKVGMRVGREDLYAQIRAFGFGVESGIDLPAESPGLLPPAARWRPITTAYVSFGQGLSASALQLAGAFAAIGNGGTLYRPRLVAAVRSSGRREATRPEVLGRPVAPTVAREVERLLEAVVEEGTGRQAAVPGYRVAGKTGTGQKAVPGQGYTDTRVVASFVGFAPARHPAVAAIVAIDEPRAGAIHGGDVAAPVFREIVRHALTYLGVAPEWEELPEDQRPPAPDEDGRRASLPLAPDNAGAAAGDGAAASRDEGSPALARLPVEAGGLPDLTGLSARQAVVRLAQLGLAARLHGAGYVRRQEPVPGTPRVAAGAGLDLWLAGQAPPLAASGRAATAPAVGEGQAP